MKFWADVKNNPVVSLFWQTNDDFSKENSSLMAAAVAYSLLFSIFPFALAMLAITGYLMASDEVEKQVIIAMGNLIPVARNLIINTLEGIIKAREATGTIAILMLIWSALAFFDALRNSLNRAWDLPDSRTYVKGKLINVSMLALAVCGLIVFTWMTTTLHYMHESHMQIWVFKFSTTTIFSRLIFMLLSAVLAYGVVLLLYHFVPSNRPRWRHIWMGALLAAIGFEIVRFSFVWYVKNFATYNLVYGPISSIIALLMFMYLTTWVLLFFARFSYVKMRRDRNGLTL